VRAALGVSERRACRALGQPRGTHRYVARVGEFVRRLVARLYELVRAFPRYGYRRMTALLRREGFRVNRKRVFRLWRQEGFRVPRRQRKRRRLGSTAQGCVRHRALAKDHVWSVDFVFDRTEDGRPLKILAVVDEHTRECLALLVRRWIKGGDVRDALARVFRARGVPRHVRSDNGPEFLAKALRTWLARAEVGPLYIEPGSPWENGYGESFLARLRDEVLDRELFTSELEARVVLEDFRGHYNHDRPHGALGYRTPAEYAASCASPDSATLRRAKQHNNTNALIQAGA